MLYGLPCTAKKPVGSHSFPLQYLLLGVLLCGALVLSGCGGGSAPGASASAPASTISSGSSGSNSSNSASGLSVPTSVPPATQGSSYSTTLKVTGGTAPYTFSIASGALPQGLGLADSSGTISGTPSASGTSNFVLAVSDAAGNSKQQALQLAVASPSTASSASPEAQSSGPSFTNLQHSGGWGQYGQQGPSYVDCSPSPCNGIAFSMTQGVQSPSLSGEATEFNVGGTAGYSDALFNNHLIGPNSTQGMPDNDQSIVPSLHDFTYDVYFYGDDFGPSQALEFDINQFFGNLGFIWGHQCRIASGNEWDVWDNVNQHWVPTGIACNPVDNSWNHVTIQVQRTSDNQLLYESISLNGVTSQVNDTYAPGTAPSNWYGITINYQMDGNYQQAPYSVYLDQLTFWYQ